jgi:hypothetical protein
MNRIGLSDAIIDLRGQLTRALDQGAGEALKFAVGAVELELEIELAVEATAKAETKWWVVSAGGETKGGRSSTHRIKLTLTPKLDGRDLQIASTTPVTR